MEQYEMAQLEEMRFAFAMIASDMSNIVARASGLMLTDTKVDASSQYVYAVELAVDTSEYKATPGYVYLSSVDYTPIPTPDELRLVEKEYVVDLDWNNLYSDLQFTGYWIERSKSPDKDWRRINEKILLNTYSTTDKDTTRKYYTDTLPELGVTYYYRIVGRTSFGDYSPYSEPAAVKGKQRIHANPILGRCEVLNNEHVQFAWAFPDSLEKRIKEFVVERSPSPKGPFDIIHKNILSNKVRRFKDKEPISNNYYRIAAVGVQGDTTRSLPQHAQLIDETPPSPPRNLTGEMDSIGLVLIQWDPSPEVDVFGYRIYRGNYEEEEFSRIIKGSITDTFYVDSVSLNSLTKSVWYKVVAIDNRYNPSEFSEALEVKRTDIIEPTSPSIVSYKTDDSGITLFWVSSTSEDVKRQILYRRDKKETVWMVLKIMEGDSLLITQFNDKSVTPGTTYEYRLIAVDESDLKSEERPPFEVKAYNNGLKPSIENVKATASPKARMVKIDWEYNEKNVERFLIYRSKVGKRITLYESVEGELSRVLRSQFEY